MRIGTLALALMWSMLPQVAGAQSAAPAFEVASIKPNTSGDPNNRIAVQPGGRYAWTNTTLKQLISTAYGFNAREIVGGPSWLESDRFDVVAKTEEGAAVLDASGAPGPLFAMLRALLEERFRVAAHKESRVRPIYALSRLRAGGSIGPRLRASDVDCAAILRQQASGTFRRDRDGLLPCAIRGRIDASAVTMPALASVLSSVTGTPVVDRTGMSGTFDVTLEFRPDFQAAFNAEPERGEPVAAADAPSIFTAVQEQLGLKLESTRGPIDVLVIDRAERPMEN